jgi:hypothetical protein
MTFHKGDRVQYTDINLRGRAGTIIADQKPGDKFVYVVWDGFPFSSNEWTPNLEPIAKA